MDEYTCKQCSQGWMYVKEDYEKDGAAHTQICPFCTESIWWSMRQVYQGEGTLRAVWEYLEQRYLRRK